VSRLLSEARRQGIVHIEVTAPPARETGLATDVAVALGLQHAYLYPDSAPEVVSAALGPPLSRALGDAELSAGDTVLVASGRMMYATARAALPPLPGVVVVPTIGGQLEPEPWYQTNEITRAFAAAVGGRPSFLYAPALPGAALHGMLLQDPHIRDVLGLWDTARCAVVGVGAPPALRTSLPGFVPAGTPALRTAVGDICSRFYDSSGRPVPFPGSERLVAMSLEALREVPFTVAVASGAEKVVGILAGARAGYFNRLVTDSSTAALLVAAAAAA
jgi:DNA-binding transcriptional regulator LsrR (DeoR family)